MTRKIITKIKSIPTPIPDKPEKTILLYKHNVTNCNSNSQRFKELSQKNQIKFTDNPQKADVIYTSKSNQLTSIIHKYPNKKFIIFTHEPYWDTTHQSTKTIMGKTVTIINCYNNYYCNNYFYFPKKAIPLSLKNPSDPIAQKAFHETKRPVCILASYHGELMGATKEELCTIRNQIGIFGHNLGKTTVYGKGWPKGVSQENSRGGKWKSRKCDILKKYYFNICFENSYIKYYVSEKLWDSIKNFNLPIYKGSPWIYEIFPKNSFLDYNDFSSPKELFHTIKNMPYSEWCRRLNLCINTFNETLKTINKDTIKDGVYLNLIKTIRS